jgi:hypothetical protein
MQVLLVVTALVLVATFVWRRWSARRDERARARGTSRSHTFAGPFVHLRGPALADLPIALEPVVPRPARTAPASRATLRLVGLDWAQVAVDDMPFTLLGITRETPDVFTSVAWGKHRVRLGPPEGAKRATLPAIDFVIDDDCEVVVSRRDDGALTVERLPLPAEPPKPAGCIHYPTWAKGPLVGRRFERSPIHVDALLDEIDEALTTRRTREHLSELGDRLVGLPLTADQLATLRKVLASHLEQAHDQARQGAETEREGLEARVFAVLPRDAIARGAHAEALAPRV